MRGGCVGGNVSCDLNWVGGVVEVGVVCVLFGLGCVGIFVGGFGFSFFCFFYCYFLLFF